jgi:methionyl-tRNA formyltransferase
LPRWRGASPIQAALLHGDDETGVTLMLMDEGLDTGPLLTQRPVPIRLDHTAGTLSAELAELGADLLVESLPRYAAGGITPRPQNAADATSAPRLSRADGRLDPSRSADDLQRQLRAYTPWPGTFLRLGEVELAVLAAHTEPGPVDRPPGTLTERGGLPMLATASGWLALERVQVPGRTVVDGASFLNGHRHLLGAASG